MTGEQTYPTPEFGLSVRCNETYANPTVMICKVDASEEWFNGVLTPGLSTERPIAIYKVSAIAAIGDDNWLNWTSDGTTIKILLAANTRDNFIVVLGAGGWIQANYSAA